MLNRSVRATDAEAGQLLPGDELIPKPVGSLTHAVTIRRPPRDVWPWLAQMGAGSRAGWYSYDFLDNGRQPSARRIVHELQSLSVGMVFPALPGATDGFTLLAFEPEKFLILGWLSPDRSPLVTWAFVLQELADWPEQPVVTGLAADKREVLVTHVMDAEPDHRKEFPDPTPWPFLTAVAVAGLYIGTMFTPYAVLWGAIPTTIGLLGWAWPRKGKSLSELEQELAHSDEPTLEHV